MRGYCTYAYGTGPRAFIVTSSQGASIHTVHTLFASRKKKQAILATDDPVIRDGWLVRGARSRTVHSCRMTRPGWCGSYSGTAHGSRNHRRNHRRNQHQSQGHPGPRLDHAYGVLECCVHAGCLDQRRFVRGLQRGSLTFLDFFGPFPPGAKHSDSPTEAIRASLP